MSALIEQDMGIKDTKIYLSEVLIDLWYSYRQMSRDRSEAFGALIGSQSADANEFWLEHCTTPQKEDSATRVNFSMRAPHHQKSVDSYYENSHGKLGYLGTWHTHPEATPIPSNIDITDWKKCIKRNPDRELVFVIVGQKDVCIFREVNGSFKRIFKERIDD